MRIDELLGYKNTTSKYIDSNNKKNYVNRMMQDAGYKFLGSGAYGSAFMHPKGYVVKVVYSGDNCYYKFVEYCLKNQNNPHLPKFKTKTLKKFDKNFYLVRMEPLLDLTEIELKAAKILIRNALNPPYTHVLGNRGEPEFPKEFDHVEEYKSFFKTVVELNKNKEKGCYNDLEHSQTNVMKRSDGIFVVLDPWYSPE